MIFVNIVWQTILDMYKGKVFYSSLFSAVILLLITYVAAEFTYGATPRVALSVGIGVATLATNLLSIFLGVSLISDEIENRTLYMILSRPVKRITFINAKVFGLALVLGANALFLFLLTVMLYFHYGGGANPLMPWNYMFIYFETLIIMFVAVLFSLFTQKIIAVLACISAWLMGHACVPLKEFSLVKHNVIINFLVESYASYGPNLYKINIKNFVTYEVNLPPDFLVNASFYAVFWILLLLVLNTIVFDHKELV